LQIQRALPDAQVEIKNDKIFFASLSYIATAFRLKMNIDAASQQVIANMIDQFIDFSQPLAYTFQVFILPYIEHSNALSNSTHNETHRRAG